MKARGNTKIILEKVGEIQNLIGSAKGKHDNDRNPDAHEQAQNELQRAFDLCLEIRDMYEPF